MVDLLGLDWDTIVQAVLFAFFSVFTAILNAITGPTYSQLFVPMMQPGNAYPAFTAGGGAANYLSAALQFSAFTVANLVDPLVAVVALGVALLYFARATAARLADRFDHLLARLVLSVLVANFSLPIAGAVLGLAGALYPVLAGWDGGAWTQWVNLSGFGQISFSWDNGALAFVLSFVEFLLVFGLLLAMGVRDALLAVLLVLLPIFSLLGPLRPLSGIARRAWLLFFELAFLPCVLVVPLELAVGTTSPVLLVGYLGAALAAPYLLSVAGTHLSAFGFPSAGGAIAGGTQLGFSAAPSSAGSAATPAVQQYAKQSPLAQTAASATATAGSASFPAAAPLAVADLVGHGARHLLAHFQPPAARPTPPGDRPRFDSVRSGRSP